MAQRALALNCLTVAVALLASPTASAKRAAPAEVAPVVAHGVRYTAPHFGFAGGQPWSGGHVQARDAKTKKLLWDRVIYRIRYDEEEEKDAQDVFITKLSAVAGTLIVTTEGGRFEMDLASGTVRAAGPLRPQLEIATATPPPTEPPTDRLECRQSSSGAYFFPAGWFAHDLRRDESERRWYSKELLAMGEPSLSCKRKGGDAIRFLWIRTWGRPITVRVESSSAGATVWGVELDGFGGYDPGKPSRRFHRDLTGAERLQLSKALDDLHFSDLPTHGGEDGLDGAEWILEGRNGGHYHVVVRWSPEDGPYREVCLSLLKLVDWLPTGHDKRDGVY